MVLAVVDLVDLTGDVRFQRCIIPVQIGQGVFSHGIPFVDDRLDGHSHGDRHAAA
jgi:hypothetical protein